MGKSITDLVNLGDVKTDPGVGDLALIKDIEDSGSKVIDLANLVQGIYNAKFDLDTGIFSLAPRNGDKFTALGLSTDNGDVKPVSSDVLSIELTTATAPATPVFNINTLLFGANPEVELCTYLILENVASVYTLYLGFSRSPNLKQVPADYMHTLTGTARTVVGVATNGSAMAISKAGTVVPANTTCIPLGFALKVTFDRTTGYASGLALTDKAAPRWNDKEAGIQTHETPIWLGYSSPPTVTTYYKIIGTTMVIMSTVTGNGTSNAVTNVVSSPMTLDSVAHTELFRNIIATNNAAISTWMVLAGHNAGVGTDGDYISGANVGTNTSGWTGSGAKSMYYNGVYTIK